MSSIQIILEIFSANVGCIWTQVSIDKRLCLSMDAFFVYNRVFFEVGKLQNQNRSCI